MATPEAGSVFEKLSKPNSILTPEDLKILEAFIIKWYCKSMTADSLDDARKCMVFERGTQPHQLPPTSAAVNIIHFVVNTKLEKYGEGLYNECKIFQILVNMVGNRMRTDLIAQFGPLSSLLLKTR